MANRIKMVQKQLLFSLFTQNWSNRKINKSIGLHRNTISRYRNEWLKRKHKKDSLNPILQTSYSYGNTSVNPSQLRRAFFV